MDTLSLSDWIQCPLEELSRFPALPASYLDRQRQAAVSAEYGNPTELIQGPIKQRKPEKMSTSDVLILNQLCSFRAENCRSRILSHLLGLVSDNPCTARIPWLEKEWYYESKFF